MNNETKLRKIITQNLIHYRKASKLTQAELAEKLNYSDKAVSKWERGESTPDIYILVELSNLYGITLNDLINEHKVTVKKDNRITHFYISILSIGLVWFISTLCYVSTLIFDVDIEKSWLIFIYGINISSIVGIVFSFLWGNTVSRCISVSSLCWSIPLTICLTIPNNKLWLLFIACIPLQILIILLFVLLKKKARVSK